MDTSLFRYIWRNTRPQQIWILIVILLSMPFYFMGLDLPKTIVNAPIQGKGFEASGATQPFLQISLPLPWTDQPLRVFDGIDMERVPYLVALSLLFLLLVFINGWFKWYINIYKGRLGERMLRRMRYELIDRVLRFPPNQFRRTKAAEVATMVKDEVEPLGGFIGDAFVQPMFLGGQALTAMIFILTQNVLLGVLAGGIVAVQAFVIPRLRRRLIVLGKERQITARELAGRVGEIVDGIAEIRVNDATNYERADISHRLGRIFWIRYELYNRKFFVKFLNNFLSQFTPFLFYLLGGWFAIRGQLDIGQLVAVIAAYKDLPGPVKELIDWDQQRLDVQVKYNQVVEQFSVDQLIDPTVQEPAERSPESLGLPVQVNRLSIIDETGARLAENVTFNLGEGERVAVLGQVNAGGESVSEALVRLLWPTSGSIRLATGDLARQQDAVTGRRMSYAGPNPFFPNQSIRDNLLYGLKHVPLQPRAYEGDALSAREAELREAAASGNSGLDVAADWIDYAAAGVSGPLEMDRRLIEVLRLVEMDEDVYQQGLRSRLDADRESELVATLLEARSELRRRLTEPQLARLVEPFDPERYSTLATVAVNLLFGTATDPAFEPANLPENPRVMRTLADCGLDEALFDMGKRIAGTMLELFGDLPPGHAFLEQLRFMTPDELPEFRAVLSRVGSQRLADVHPDDRRQLLRLPLAYIEPEHRLGLLDPELQARIVEARKALRAELGEDGAVAVAFYDPDAYNRASSVQDNILFGRIALGVADGPERVRRLIQETLERLGAGDAIHRAGLGFQVGSGGKRLSGPQRQKIAVARAVLKRPDLLVINKGLSALDTRVQRAIAERIVARKDGERASSIFWVLSNPALAPLFDRVMVFADGQLVEDGPPDELASRGGAFAKLTAAA